MCETLLYAKGRGIQPRRHLESQNDAKGSTPLARDHVDDHIVLRRRGNTTVNMLEIFGSMGERYRTQIERGGAI